MFIAFDGTFFSIVLSSLDSNLQGSAKERELDSEVSYTYFAVRVAKTKAGYSGTFFAQTCTTDKKLSLHKESHHLLGIIRNHSTAHL